MGPRLGGNYRVARKAVLADGSEYFFDRQNVQFARAPASEYVAELQALFKSLERLRYLLEISGEGTLLVMLIPANEERFAMSADDNPQDVMAHVTNRFSELGVPFLDLYPILCARGAEKAVYLPRDLHLNALGNQTVAETFIERREAGSP